ncbi:MAG: efflux RND transporter permease subunit, partial [Gammaproteobacteria bacterium]
MVIGAILLIVVIGAFLFDWRSALVSVISIPLALLAALFTLYLTGATLNSMILVGLVVALGVVIDDAIVDSERLLTKLRERGATGGSIAALIYETTLETRSATIYATLIVALAVMPILFMGGISGAFFHPLALSYILAVLASMVIALTVTPALSLLLLGRTPRVVRESPVAVWLRSGYEAVLRKAVGAPRASIGVAAVAVAAGIAVWPLLGQSLLPSLQERDLLVNLTTAPGTSHRETFRITSRVREELRSLPGVLDVGAHVGRAITGDQIVDVNSSQVWVRIDPEFDRDTVVGSIREVIDGYPGMERNLQSYLRDQVSEVLTGASNAIVVRIFGPKREILREKAEEVRKALAGISGIVDLRADAQVELPQIEVKV